MINIVIILFVILKNMYYCFISNMYIHTHIFSFSVFNKHFIYLFLERGLEREEERERNIN